MFAYACGQTGGLGHYTAAAEYTYMAANEAMKRFGPAVGVPIRPAVTNLQDGGRSASNTADGPGAAASCPNGQVALHGPAIELELAVLSRLAELPEDNGVRHSLDAALRLAGTGIVSGTLMHQAGIHG